MIGSQKSDISIQIQSWSDFNLVTSLVLCCTAVEVITKWLSKHQQTAKLILSPVWFHNNMLNIKNIIFSLHSPNDWFSHLRVTNGTLDYNSKWKQCPVLVKSDTLCRLLKIQWHIYSNRWHTCLSDFLSVCRSEEAW